ncbi:uncharacterized protein C8A04DRAFT_26987 [Dichotomopilus funicola]|uniref:Uncharacterized protein n=1 Tax=Dichotomopilus funicola TaxID=1934379 RepID=A0AAN6V6E2_9PEZI|nr:hypothetical protein C8A04DRAFT_26987 [Dichotomopilus funicola]
MPPLQPLLLLHALIETPASLTFLHSPDSQLSHASPDARLILQSYGGLLFATNLLALAIVRYEDGAGIGDELGFGGGNGSGTRLKALACLCFAVYHVWPAKRALVRIVMEGKGGGGGKGGKKVLGGPKVHLVVHVVMFGLLLGGGVLGLLEG